MRPGMRNEPRREVWAVCPVCGHQVLTDPDQLRGGDRMVPCQACSLDVAEMALGRGLGITPPLSEADALVIAGAVARWRWSTDV